MGSGCFCICSIDLFSFYLLIEKIWEGEVCRVKMLELSFFLLGLFRVSFREESEDEEHSVLPRHTKVIVLG